MVSWETLEGILRLKRRREGGEPAKIRGDRNLVCMGEGKRNDSGSSA